MAAQLIQMVTVVDKSGKAVNSSKHIVGVWKEAKAAYKERKAEVAAERKHERDGRPSPRRAKTFTVEDDYSRSSSHRHSNSRHHSGERRRSFEDRRRSAHSPKTAPTSPSSIYPSSISRWSQDISQSCPNSLISRQNPDRPTSTSPGIQRSSSARADDLQLVKPPALPPRSYTSPSIRTVDMDLAYGELHDDLPLTSQQAEEQELKGLVGTAKRLLEEADCLHHSATKTMAMLQKNPEAMAAVALTLAEISNIARKLAPGALANIGRSAPAVFSLLASPQFLIAGGVAVGITIVAFGGFKVIKKIRERQAGEIPGMVEMLEIPGDINRIDDWRRGIAEEQASSIGTSVEGEFITPNAAALSRLNLEESWNPPKESRREKKPKTSKARSGSEKPSKHASRSSSKASSSKATSKDGGSAAGSTDRKERQVVKRPSPLRLMFQ